MCGSLLRSTSSIFWESAAAQVSYSDPYVPEIRLEDNTLLAQDSGALEAADCVVIVTDHAAFDYKDLVKKAKLIVDTRNALKGVQSEKIVRL